MRGAQLRGVKSARLVNPDGDRSELAVVLKHDPAHEYLFRSDWLFEHCPEAVSSNSDLRSMRDGTPTSDVLRIKDMRVKSCHQGMVVTFGRAYDRGLSVAILLNPFHACATFTSPHFFRSPPPRSLLSFI